MTLTKKIIFYLTLTVLSLPCIMIFNDAEEMWYINAFGIAYAYGMCKIAPHILPKWFIDYLNEEPEWMKEEDLD